MNCKKCGKELCKRDGSCYHEAYVDTKGTKRCWSECIICGLTRDY